MHPADKLFLVTFLLFNVFLPLLKINIYLVQLTYALLTVAIVTQMYLIRHVWNPLVMGSFIGQMAISLEFGFVGVAIMLTGFALSLYWYFIYGPFDFKYVKPTGKFRVGFTEFHTSVKSNAVSVFYPCERSED